MNKIIVMDEILANKIAAGEVIDRCMNVVKELVENSIDASSTHIKITLIDAGTRSIEVKDDGVGMTKEDAILAFERHATSKLKTIDDLFNITSLGFRGEALPSIASVSKVTLQTSDGNVGTIISISGGIIENITNASLRKGTTITVQDLFYNTPVRLKYLKNLYVELASISEYVNKMALANPFIKFELINNERVLLNTSGSGNKLQVIKDVYGLEVAKKSQEINSYNDDYAIKGYITYPEITRSNKNGITILVNGRLIQNSEITKTIFECYHTYIPINKYPLVTIDISTDPYLIDVNIHPTKMDIKFSKIEALKDLLIKTITKELETLSLIPSAVRGEVKEVDNKEVKVEYTYQEVEPTTFEVNEAMTLFQETLPLNSKEDRVKEMYPVGLVHGTYIIAENEDGMYIIDQHAAAERINYEKYFQELSKKNNKSLPLLVPLTFELSSSDFLILEQHLDLLTNLGFENSIFGNNTIVVRSHPLFIKEGYEKESIEKIISLIVTLEDFSQSKFIEQTAITMACKMSIKANDHIAFNEMKYLLDNLRTCKNPFTCPHGRPTIISYTKYDLEKLFKRSMN